MNHDAPFTIRNTDRLGLALSGGGFRAALFHLGVLAKMAELDLLRHVQMLSTVSGGSIIGAMYYLKVKQLLEHERTDGVIPSTPGAYVKIVQELETEFLKGVQTNLRVRALLNPIKNAKMFISDDYSRSDRMSELYNETFYRPIQRPGKETLRDWLQDALSLKDCRDIFLKDLKIVPKGERPGFDVALHNRDAEHKIPVLNINATTLNSGDNWVFTASYVGVASSDRYPRISFANPNDPGLSPEQNKKRAAILNKLTLSDAVAASACVPALFAPFAIHDLYGEKDVIELVDGGVFDNQGLTALTDGKCTHIICSDASGQLCHDRSPASGMASVFMRSNDVLMKRVRDLIVRELEMKEGGKTVDARFWHLREGFGGTPYFRSFSPPPDSSDYNQTGADNGQIFLLSAIRTDLDAFADIEANALMYDGYCLCDRFLNQSEGLKNPPSLPWGFYSVMTSPTLDSCRLTHCLAVGGDMFFKVFRLTDTKGKLLGAGLGLVVLLSIWAFVYEALTVYADRIQGALAAPGWTAAVVVFGMAGWTLMKKLPHPVQHWQKWLAEGVRTVRTGNVLGLVYPLAIVGSLVSIVAFFYLKVINPRYLKLGR
ncbi:patatin-like phospholipase family protein [Methylococcus capsulatus]|jgi:NTE family protein|uniref:NTE family protein n=1 Tax=Methylococcus capsulatus TaxID=414 RepID=A0AA35XTB2_METCP|nr:patatin-like phospholipase family protein [Methylococcus capsulatus]CAI8786629.1 NTE family protein [Methylococcus capsulatus]